MTTNTHEKIKILEEEHRALIELMRKIPRNHVGAVDTIKRIEKQIIEIESEILKIETDHLLKVMEVGNPQLLSKL